MTAAYAHRRDLARVGDIIDAPGTPDADRPQVVFEELIDEWKHAILNDPRTLQDEIGPSGIGDECDRSLIRAVAEFTKAETKVNFKAWVGKAVHHELERIFGANPRYLVELPVTCGTIGGKPLKGSLDLYDTETHTIVDWKSKGPSTLAGHKKNGAGQLYRVQRHTYGLGAVAAGLPVRHVLNVYFPRNGEFRDIIYDAEPYDPQIALDAIARAEGMAQLVAGYGLPAALEMFPTLCTDIYCDWCPYERAKRPALALPSTKDVLGINA
jgi:hypothetical protein